MWKKFYDLAQMVFTFGQQTQRNQSSIETLQQEVKQLTGAVQRMAYERQRLRDDFDHFKDNERHEREKSALWLENEMLKFERRLPSGRQGEQSPALRLYSFRMSKQEL